MTRLRDVVGSLAFVAVLGVLLFACAGRADLPWFWAYLAMWAASAVIGPLVVDPTLIKERLQPGPGGQDYLTAALFLVVGAGQHVIAAVDVGRFHWTDTVPRVVHLFGLVAMASALAVIVWAMAVNRFFSSVIRIQTDRGHELVTAGPYRYVRHPAYAVGLLLMVGVGLALGSWLGALFGFLLVPTILSRTAREDRVLRERLTGYAAYAREVRYRLLPGVW